MPTHMMPRSLDSSTAAIAAADPNQSVPNRRADRRERLPVAVSARKYPQAYTELAPKTRARTARW